MKPERQEYEEQFARKTRLRSEIEMELNLRREVLLELAEEQERLSTGVSKEELEIERGFAKREVIETRNRQAIASGNLEALIKEEELEKQAERIRGKLQMEFGLERALSRAPVFLLAAAKRAQTKRMFEEHVFNSLVKSKLNKEGIKRAIRSAGFANGELAVDKKRAIAIIRGAKGRALLNALKTA